jgi:hypothetical protein
MTATPVFAPGQQEETPVWQSYLDVMEDVRPWLQFNTSGEPQVEAKLRLITEAACYRIQNYLGKPIGPTLFARRSNGWPRSTGAYLMLPYYPILKVIKVVEWWGVSGPHELKEQTPEEQVGAEAFQVDNTRGYLVRTFQGLIPRPWFPGSKNIEVEWEAGFNPVPPDLKKATLELIAHEWRREQQASEAPGPAPAGGGHDEPPLGYYGEPPDVMRVLTLYQQVGIG